MASKTNKMTPKPKPLPAKEEKRLEVVAGEFPDQPDAVRYGRKLLKLKAGLRTTPAPRGTLTDKQAARVRELLGVPATGKSAAK
jgi:hypothetical protein